MAVGRSQAHSAVHTVCVFCGANSGADPGFLAAAGELGGSLARAGLAVVYGGASIGLMGALADAVLDAGGVVTGVVPSFLPDGKVHRSLTGTRVVATMHERKTAMAGSADAFVVLPGGLGTLDEMFETLTWNQLGIHAKPVVLINTNGFFDPLLEFLDRCYRQGLVLRPAAQILTVVEHPADAVTVLTTTPNPQGVGHGSDPN
jgi:uncharacterized protein (TIGR00730 family)